jgi:hypothetical protein
VEVAEGLTVPVAAPTEEVGEAVPARTEALLLAEELSTALLL